MKKLKVEKYSNFTPSPEIGFNCIISISGPITCLSFDAAGEYLLIAGDKQIKIFRNIPGYRATIKSSKKKLEQRQTSATRERLETTIADCKSFLEKMGEKYPQ